MLRTKRSKFFTLLTILVIGAFVLSPIGPLSTPAATEVAATEPSKVPSSTPTLAPLPTSTNTRIPTITLTPDPDDVFLANLTDRTTGLVDLKTNADYAAWFDTMGNGADISHNGADAVRCKNDEKVVVLIPGDWIVTWTPGTGASISKCGDTTGFTTIDLGQHPDLSGYPWIAAINEQGNEIPLGRDQLKYHSVHSIGWRTDDGIEITDKGAEAYVLCGKFTVSEPEKPTLDNFYVMIVTKQDIADDNGVIKIQATSVDMDVWEITDGNAQDVNTALQQCHQMLPKRMIGHASHMVVYDPIGRYWGNLAFLHPSK